MLLTTATYLHDLLRLLTPSFRLFGSSVLCFFVVISCGYIGFEKTSGDEDGSEVGSDGIGGGGNSTMGENRGGASQGGAPASGSAAGSACRDDESCPRIISESFETKPKGRPVIENGAALSWSSSVSRSGRALCAEQGKTQSQAEYRVRVERLSDVSTYFRAWVHVPTGAITGRIKILGLNDNRGESTDVVLNPQGRIDVHLETTEERATSHPDAYPEGEWFCLEASTFIDDNAGWVRVEVDGQLVTEIEKTDTRPGKGISLVAYGMALTEEGQVGGRLYFDDVAMAYRPIGCD